MRKIRKSILVSLMSLAILLTATLGIWNSLRTTKAFETDYYTGIMVNINEAGYGNGVILASDVTEQQPDGSWKVDKVIYSTMNPDEGDALPSEILLSIYTTSGNNTFTHHIIHNSIETPMGGTSAMTNEVAIVPSSTLAKFTLLTKNPGGVIVQTTAVSIGIVYVDGAELFDGKLVDQHGEPVSPNGTKDNPFIINTAEQLDRMRFFLSSHFELGTNIDLGAYACTPNEFDRNVSYNSNWRGIGYNAYNSFMGSFDGKGKTISNLNLFNDSFFRHIKGATVKNINFENSYLKLTAEGSAVFARTAIDPHIQNVNMDAQIDYSVAASGFIYSLSFTQQQERVEFFTGENNLHFDYNCVSTATKTIGGNSYLVERIGGAFWSVSSVDNPDIVENVDTRPVIKGINLTFEDKLHFAASSAAFCAGNLTRVILENCKITADILAYGSYIAGVSPNFSYADFGDECEITVSINDGLSESGTGDHPVTLLAGIAYGITPAGATARIGDDVTVDARIYVPRSDYYYIGGLFGNFGGNGGGHLIIGDDFDCTTDVVTNSRHTGGLIGRTGANSSVKIGDNAYINVIQLVGMSEIGGLIGNAGGTSFSLVVGDNAEIVVGTVTSASGSTHIGGLIGNLSGTGAGDENSDVAKVSFGDNLVIDIENVVGVNGVSPAGVAQKSSYVGGLFGSYTANATQTATNLSSKLIFGDSSKIVGTGSKIKIGRVVAPAGYVGGIIGNQTATACYFDIILGDIVDFEIGHVSGGADYVGGFAGHSQFRNFDFGNNKFEVGDVTGGRYVGGFFGTAYAQAYFKNLDLANLTIRGNHNGTTAGGIAGGFAGYAYGIFDNISLRETTVLVTGNTAGGLMGVLNNSPNGNPKILTASLKNSVAINVEIKAAAEYVGGLIGQAYAAEIDNVETSAVVSGTNYVAGAFGRLDNCSVNDATVKADATGIGSVGGLIGYSNNTAVINVSNIEIKPGATLTLLQASNYVGGIVGQTVTHGINISDAIIGAGMVINANGTANVGGIAGVSLGGSANGGPIIKDVQVLGLTINAAGSTSGGLVGSAAGFTKITGTNSVKVVIDSNTNNIGGLVGNLSTATAMIEGTNTVDAKISGNSNLGGLVGNVEGTVSGTNTFVAPLVIRAIGHDIGGLIGLFSATAKLADSINVLDNVEISAASNSERIGGLIGRQHGLITNSDNTINSLIIQGYNYTGGLIGASWVATASMTGGSDRGTNTIGTATIKASANIGGLYGSLTANSTISNITNNFGNIYILGTSSLGGIVGSMSGKMTNCTNTIDKLHIQGTSSLGGIAGSTAATTAPILACANTITELNLEGTSALGGIVGTLAGDIGSAIIDGSTIGTVNTLGSVYLEGTSGLGGIVGSQTGIITTTTNTIELIYIKGTNSLGGIVGSMGSAAIFRDSSVDVIVGSIISEEIISGANRDAVGGLFGSISGKVLNVSATINVDGSSFAPLNLKGVDFVGSIIGRIATSGEAAFANTIQLGEVRLEGRQYMGGMVGYMYAGGKLILSSSVDKLTISSTSNNLGGVIGAMATFSGDIPAAVMSGEHMIGDLYIEGVSSIGGMVGSAAKETSIVGTIQITKADLIASGATVGGLFGSLDGTLQGGDNSIGSLYIKSQSSTLGGLAGAMSGIIRNNDNTIVSLYIEGASTTVGGLVGSLSGSLENRNNRITEIYLKGFNAVGGFVGTLTGTISNQNNTIEGNLYIKLTDTSNTGSVGGAIGSSGAAARILNTVFELADVQIDTKGQHAGGFIGSASGIIENIELYIGDISIKSGNNFVAGLMGSMNDNARFSLANELIMGKVYLDGAHYVGGLVGNMYNGSFFDGDVKIDEIYILSNFNALGGLVGQMQAVTLFYGNHSIDYVYINGTGSIGGIVGVLNENCTVSGNNQLGTVELFGRASGVGGLVGSMSGSLIDGENSIDSVYLYSMAGYIGGLFGGMGTNARVSNVKNTLGPVHIEGKADYLGGFTGSFGGVMENTVNSITSVYIKGYNDIAVTPAYVDYIGGLFGTMAANSSYIFQNEIHIQKISIVGRNYIGGLVGIIYNGAIFEGSAKLDNVLLDGKGQEVAGLVGRLSARNATNNPPIAGAKITGEYEIEKLNIKATHYLGGLVGYIYDSAVADVSTTLGSVEIEGISSIGGLIGVQYGSLQGGENTIDSLTINATNTSIGGLAGQMGTAAGKIQNTKNTITTAYLNSTANTVGGLVGSLAQYGVLSSDNEITTLFIMGAGGYKGGLVGSFSGIISADATNTLGTVYIEGSQHLGGVLGVVGTTAENYSETTVGTIYLNGSSDQSGGLYGQVNGATKLQGTNRVTTMHIKGTDYLAAVVGNLISGGAVDSSNIIGEAFISGRNYLGGVIAANSNGVATFGGSTEIGSLHINGNSAIGAIVGGNFGATSTLGGINTVTSAKIYGYQSLGGMIGTMHASATINGANTVGSLELYILRAETSPIANPSVGGFISAGMPNMSAATNIIIDGKIFWPGPEAVPSNVKTYIGGSAEPSPVEINVVIYAQGESGYEEPSVPADVFDPANPEKVETTNPNPPVVPAEPTPVEPEVPADETPENPITPIDPVIPEVPVIPDPPTPPVEQLPPVDKIEIEDINYDDQAGKVSLTHTGAVTYGYQINGGAIVTSSLAPTDIDVVYGDSILFFADNRTFLFVVPFPVVPPVGELSYDKVSGKVSFTYTDNTRTFTYKIDDGESKDYELGQIVTLGYGEEIVFYVDGVEYDSWQRDVAPIGKLTYNNNTGAVYFDYSDPGADITYKINDGDEIPYETLLAAIILQPNDTIVFFANGTKADFIVDGEEKDSYTLVLTGTLTVDLVIDKNDGTDWTNGTAEFFLSNDTGLTLFTYQVRTAKTESETIKAEWQTVTAVYTVSGSTDAVYQFRLINASGTPLAQSEFYTVKIETANTKITTDFAAKSATPADVFDLVVTISPMPISGVASIIFEYEGNTIKTYDHDDLTITTTSAFTVAALEIEDLINKNGNYRIVLTDNSARRFEYKFTVSNIIVDKDEDFEFVDREFKIINNSDPQKKYTSLTFALPIVTNILSVQYSRNGGAKNTISTYPDFTVTENGDYVVYINFRGGAQFIYSKKLEIRNIDSTVPIFSVKYDNSNWINTTAVIEGSVTNIGSSGLSSLRIYRNGAPFAHDIRLPDQATTFNFSIEVETRGVYTFDLTTGAGLVIRREARVLNIDLNREMYLTVRTELTSQSALVNGWTDDSVRISLSTIGDAGQINCEVKYYMSRDYIDDVTTCTWEEVPSIIWFTSNTYEKLVFMAMTETGVDAYVLEPVEIKIDRSADIKVYSEYQNATAVEAGTANFEIWSATVKSDYTVWYIETDEFGAPIGLEQLVSDVADGKHKVSLGIEWNVQKYYTFILRSERGFEAEYQVVVGNDTELPVLSVSYDDFENGKWYTEYTFNLSVENVAPPIISGVTYYYRTYNVSGDILDDWVPVGGNTLTIYEADHLRYEFKVVTGAQEEDSYLVDNIIQVDSKAKMTLEFWDEQKEEYINFDDASPDWCTELKVRLTSAPISGLGGIYVGYPRSNWIDPGEHIFTQNGTYVFDVSNIAGITEKFTYEIFTIDAIEPLFTVVPVNASTSPTPPISDSVEFIFSLLNVGASGFKHYEYGVSTDGVTIAWNKITEFTKTEADQDGVGKWIITNKTLSASYFFRAVSNSGAYTETRVSYSFNLNNAQPDISYESLDLPTTWQGHNVDIPFIVNWGNDGNIGQNEVYISSGNSYVERLEQISAPNAVEQEWKLVMKANGTVTITVKGANGRLASTTIELQNIIDKEPPDFSVTSPSAVDLETAASQGYRWVNGAVVFNFSLHSNNDSGVRYYYSTERLDVIDDVSMLDEYNALSSFTSSADNGNYYFYAVSGAGLFVRSEVWCVRIDKGEPTFTPLNGNSPSSYTGEDVVVTFTVQYTGAIGELELGYGAIPANLSEERDVDNLRVTYTYTFNSNGSFTVRAINPNGKTSDYVQLTSNGRIDKHDVTYTITTQKGGSDVRSEGVHYASDPIVFIFTLTSGNISPVTFEYTTDNGTTWDLVGTVSSVSPVVMLSNPENATYQFRAYSAARPSALGTIVSGSNLLANNGPWTVNYMPGLASPQVSLYGYFDDEGNVVESSVLPSDRWYKGGTLADEQDPIVALIKVVWALDDISNVLLQNGINLERVSKNGLISIYKLELTGRRNYSVEALQANDDSTAFNILAEYVDNDGNTINNIYIDNRTPVLQVSTSYAGEWTKDNTLFTLNLSVAPFSMVRYAWADTEDGSNGWNYITQWTYDTSCEFWATVSGTYYFRVVSQVDSESIRGSYEVKIDTGVPTLEIAGYRIGEGAIVSSSTLPTALTNKAVTVYVKLTSSPSGASLSNLAFDNVNEFLDWNLDGLIKVYSYTFLDNGSISTTANAGNGNNSAVLTLDINIIDTTIPPILGLINGREVSSLEMNGRSYSRNVQVYIEGYESYETVIKDSKGKEVNAKFVNGQYTFTKNGTYTILVIDAAGNPNEVVFTIAKPNYALISIISVLSVAAIVSITVLIVINFRNRKALRNLIAASSISDDPNKFVMFKKIK